MFDHIKNEFPIFQRSIHGHPLVFLDSAASAQKPQRVIDSMTDVYRSHYANINRGVYTLSEESTALVEKAREDVAHFIVAKPREVIFTRNATESINLVAYSWGRKNLTKGDIVVISEMEHHANIVPWQVLRDEIGIDIYWIPVDEKGYLEFDRFISECLPQNRLSDVKLVSITHVSNVLGTINPVQKIIDWAHSIGAKILIDGAQAVTNFAVDVSSLDCDWYVFSSHKLYGPSGVGVLYGKYELLTEMSPFLTGGDMILEVHKDKTVFQNPPHKFEAGTPAIAEIIGLGESIRFVSELGMTNVRQHSIELVDYFNSLVASHSDLQLRVFGPTNNDDRVGVMSLAFEGIHPHDVATILDGEGIAIRSGHHCAQPLCERYGVSALCRASFGVYTTREDLDALFTGLKLVQKTFS